MKVTHDLLTVLREKKHKIDKLLFFAMIIKDVKHELVSFFVISLYLKVRQ